jgi:hypothetical protein
MNRWGGWSGDEWIHQNVLPGSGLEENLPFGIGKRVVQTQHLDIRPELDLRPNGLSMRCERTVCDDRFDLLPAKAGRPQRRKRLFFCMRCVHPVLTEQPYDESSEGLAAESFWMKACILLRKLRGADLAQELNTINTSIDRTTGFTGEFW